MDDLGSTVGSEEGNFQITLTPPPPGVGSPRLQASRNISYLRASCVARKISINGKNIYALLDEEPSKDNHLDNSIKVRRTGRTTSSNTTKLIFCKKTTIPDMVLTPRCDHSGRVPLISSSGFSKIIPRTELRDRLGLKPTNPRPWLSFKEEPLRNRPQHLQGFGNRPRAEKDIRKMIWQKTIGCGL